MHDACCVANGFFQLSKESGKLIESIKVECLVYIAHACMLAKHNQPLVMQQFQVGKSLPEIAKLASGVIVWIQTPYCFSGTFLYTAVKIK